MITYVWACRYWHFVPAFMSSFKYCYKSTRSLVKICKILRFLTWIFVKTYLCQTSSWTNVIACLWKVRLSKFHMLKTRICSPNDSFVSSLYIFMLDYKFIKKNRIINSCTKNNGCLILFEDKELSTQTVLT